jgi:hypothetical protein
MRASRWLTRSRARRVLANARCSSAGDCSAAPGGAFLMGSARRAALLLLVQPMKSPSRTGGTPATPVACRAALPLRNDARRKCVAHLCRPHPCAFMLPLLGFAARVPTTLPAERTARKGRQRCMACRRGCRYPTLTSRWSFALIPAAPPLRQPARLPAGSCLLSWPIGTVLSAPQSERLSCAVRARACCAVAPRSREEQKGCSSACTECCFVSRTTSLTLAPRCWMSQGPASCSAREGSQMCVLAFMRARQAFLAPGRQTAAPVSVFPSARQAGHVTREKHQGS